MGRILKVNLKWGKVLYLVFSVLSLLGSLSLVSCAGSAASAKTSGTSGLCVRVPKTSPQNRAAQYNVSDLEVFTVIVDSGRFSKSKSCGQDEILEFTDLPVGHYNVTALAKKADGTVTGKADATSGSNAATIDANQGKTNATSITVGSDGTATTHFYLQDGQYITILGLAKNTVYTVDESEEDYSKSATIKKSDSSLNWDGTEGFDALTDAVSGTIADADIHTGFTNDRSGDIPTGILSTVGGSAALAVVGIAGIAGGAMYLRKKKSEED